MNSAPDMRIPVVFGRQAAGLSDAVLIEGQGQAPPGAYAVRFTLAETSLGHAAGCTCCTPRGPAETALAAMFRARATAAAPFFTCVVVSASPAGETAIRNALNEDIFVAARYYVA